MDVVKLSQEVKIETKGHVDTRSETSLYFDLLTAWAN